MNFPLFKGTYSYIYSPPFSPGAYLSSSDLTLLYRAKSKNGFGAGVNFFPEENIGLRIEASYFRTSLEVESSKYKISLQYVSMQPPSYTPRLFSNNAVIDWEPVHGDIKRFNTNFDLIYRFKMGKGVGGEFLAGFSYEISKLSLGSLGYTKFWLGGHSVLFSETYKISFSSGLIKDWGLTGGGAVNIPLMRHVDLSFGVRYFYFPLRFASIELLEQVNKGETIGSLDSNQLELIKDIMKLPPIEFPQSYYSLTTSLRFKF